MSDLFKSALSYIGSSTSNTSSSTSNNGQNPQPSSEIIKLGGESVRLLKVIAEGGCSYVYGGQFVKTGLVIAVKKIPCQHDNEDKILSEIKYMNGFNHVNIARYHGYNKLSGVYWIGMEYCTSLRLPLPSTCVASVFGQIVRGVEYLHNFGIIHWDLKVENCMLGRDHMIKIIDFGSANTTTYNTSQLTTMQRNQLEDAFFQFTTPMYRPPEILDLWSDMVIDSHVDLWALGCILYYLVHSEHPFSDSNKLAIINCKYTKKPSNYQKIIDGLLVVNPTDRWPLTTVLNELRSLTGVDLTAAINDIPFEEFQISTPIIPNTQSSSFLHSIRGGAENLFKNIKESSSRIYSAQQPQQQPPPTHSHQRENPLQSIHRPPPPPPPPQLSQKSKVSDESSPPPLRRKLSGENQVNVKPVTAFDLLSGFSSEEQDTSTIDGGVGSTVQSDQPRSLFPEESIDLMGGFKDDSLDLIGGSIPIAGLSQQVNSSSGAKPGDHNYLDDLFSLNQINPAPLPTIKAELKKDPFDSILSEEPTTSLTQKPLILPTSSSFSQLSSLKVESKSDMVKSTPNLNDLFGDLLIDPNMKSGGGGQSATTTSFGQPSTSVPFSNSMGMSYGRNTVSSTNNNNPTTITPTNSFTPNVPNFNNSHVGGVSVPFVSATTAVDRGAGNNFPTSQMTFLPSATTAASSTFASDSAAASKSVFGASTTTQVPTPSSNSNSKKVDLNAEFGEFLMNQGFTGVSSTTTTNKTINEMRRTELCQTKTVEQIRVSEWVEGKRKNLRALLSTLHTVTWETCTWKPAGMSLMVEANDVKKVYRKACLAIHPDKQRGEDHEELSKLIFVELNEAWSVFENENFR